MGFFYFDESIQSRGDFILGAWVYSEKDIEEQVGEALKKNGLIPGRDEFKSSYHMGRNPVQAALRDDLKMVLQNCRIAVVIAPIEKRSAFGEEGCRGLLKVLRNNDLPPDRHEAFLDQSLFSSVGRGQAAAQALALDQLCDLYFEQDSRKILGLQLADLAAHTCGTMLLELLGLIKKTVPAGENSGYDSEMPMEIGFELWATIRYNFFCPSSAPITDLLTGSSTPDEISYPQVDISSSAVHIADTCSEPLRNAANGRFGLNYLGCIH
jgi:hypothetical protein